MTHPVTPKPALVPGEQEQQEKDQGLGKPDPQSEAAHVRQITPALPSEIAVALQWLDAFVEEPEYFPGEGDYGYWRERRQRIRDLAKHLHRSSAGAESDHVSFNQNPSPSPDGKQGALPQPLAVAAAREFYASRGMISQYLGGGDTPDFEQACQQFQSVIDKARSAPSHVGEQGEAKSLEEKESV